MITKAQYYNVKYTQRNYFHYREWLYAPYIASLVSYTKLKPGSRVLDVGCGQGLFSSLFHRCGMSVLGIDLSEVGVRMAEEKYARPGLTFSVGDIQSANGLQDAEKFDCIFVRSCSLYNSREFGVSDDITTKLVRYLKTDGLFIFAYYTTFGRRASGEWHYHSLSDVAKHFARFLGKRVFFCTRLDTLIIRKFALTALVTGVNWCLSKLCGIGGDAICIFRMPSSDESPRVGQ